MDRTTMTVEIESATGEPLTAIQVERALRAEDIKLKSWVFGRTLLAAAVLRHAKERLEQCIEMLGDIGIGGTR